jgi:YidC/Oxa1 family membrane protein insertase
MAARHGRRRPSGIIRPPRPLLGLLLLVCATTLSVSAEELDGDRVRVTTNRLDLVFSLDGASPMLWRACHPSCAMAGAAAATSVRFTSDDDPPQARLYLRGPGPTVDLQRLRFTADLTEDARARMVTFRSDLPGGGVRMIKSFEISREGYEVVMTVRLSGEKAAAFMTGRRLELELGSGRGILPAPAPGFSALLDRVSRVVIAGGGVSAVSDDARDPTPLRAGDWVGFRGRFWAVLLRSDDAGVLEPRSGAGVALVTSDEPGPFSWRYTFYSGPLESRALTRADPGLERLLFSGLWSWLRALSLALLFFLQALTALVGQPGLAIVALAVSVKVLLLPLSVVAERWQEQVNATQARLQPGLDAVKAAHRGEERAQRTMALYREEGVHPLFTLRSLPGVLIQLPVFVAVFDMLAEDFDLSRAGFLWIQDLSRPDELLRLPVCLPFFGCALNLLPFLMSGVSLAALLRFRSSALTPSLVCRQRRNLTGMTVLFFLLFYTFPAGMVLYWTSTNAFQLVAQEMKRRLGRAGGR